MLDLKHILVIAKEAGALKRIKRTGWVRIGLQASAESVADHSFRTALLVMLLTRNRQLDQNKMVNMALIHDLGESATSDIRYEQGKKIIASKDAKHTIEEDILKRLFSKFDKENYYLNLWYEFENQRTEEAQLVKQIEKIEMAIQALEYQEMGTPGKLLNEFFENAEVHIKDKELKRFLNIIEKERKMLKLEDNY